MFVEAWFAEPLKKVCEIPSIFFPLSLFAELEQRKYDSGFSFGKKK